jgi:hypothetical protein
VGYPPASESRKRVKNIARGGDRSVAGGESGAADGAGDPVADGGIGSVEVVVRGDYLVGRGLRDGDRVTVRIANEDAAPPLAGTVCLAAGTAHGHVGRLALGVARYDAVGRLSVWSDDGRTKLCCCDDARAVGTLAGALLALAALAWLVLEPQAHTAIALLTQAVA